MNISSASMVQTATYQNAVNQGLHCEVLLFRQILYWWGRAALIETNPLSGVNYTACTEARLTFISTVSSEKFCTAYTFTTGASWDKEGETPGWWKWFWYRGLKQYGMIADEVIVVVIICIVTPFDNHPYICFFSATPNNCMIYGNQIIYFSVNIGVTL